MRPLLPLIFTVASLAAPTYTPKKPEPAKPLTAPQNAYFTKGNHAYFTPHHCSCHRP